MQEIDTKEELIYLRNKITGKKVKGVVQISPNFEDLEFTLLTLLTNPAMIDAISNDQMFRRIHDFQTKTKDMQARIIIPLSNCIQLLHFDEEKNKIVVKDLVSRLCNAFNIEHSPENPKLRNQVLGALSYSLKIFENLSEAEEHHFVQQNFHLDESLAITAEEAQQLKGYDPVFEHYLKACEIMDGLELEDLLHFLQLRINPYDSFYSIQHLVLHMLKIVYPKVFKNVSNLEDAVGEELSLGAVLQLKLGYPIYDINIAEKKKIFHWFSQRNWPKKSHIQYYSKNDAKAVATGVSLHDWVTEILTALRIFSNHQQQLGVGSESGFRGNQSNLSQELDAEELKWFYTPLVGNTSLNLVEVKNGSRVEPEGVLEVRVVVGNQGYVWKSVPYYSYGKDCKLNVGALRRKVVACSDYSVVQAITGSGGELSEGFRDDSEYIFVKESGGVFDNENVVYCDENALEDLKEVSDGVLNLYQLPPKPEDDQNLTIFFVKVTESKPFPIRFSSSKKLSLAIPAIQAAIKTHLNLELTEEEIKESSTYRGEKLNFGLSLGAEALLGSNTNSSNTFKEGLLVFIGDSKNQRVFKKDIEVATQIKKPSIYELLLSCFSKRVMSHYSQFKKVFIDGTVLGVDIRAVRNLVDVRHDFVLKGAEFMPDDFDMMIFEKRYEVWGVYGRKQGGRQNNLFVRSKENPGVFKAVQRAGKDSLEVGWGDVVDLMTIEKVYYTGVNV